MKTSLLKKLAIAFAVFAAFAGSASAYYHSGDILGTTGFGTKNSPIQVNTFNELKAALEHPEIDYVELGDVSGEDGLIRLGEEGESGSVESAIVITTTKFLKLVGKAEFTRDPNYKKATTFIKVNDAGDSWGKLSVDGEGSLTYASISSEQMFFTGGDYSTLVINSGNLTCTYNKSTASHCTTINNGRGSLYIYGGYIKEESNDGLTYFDGCQSCDKAVFVGSYGH